MISNEKAIRIIEAFIDSYIGEHGTLETIEFLLQSGANVEELQYFGFEKDEIQGAALNLDLIDLPFPLSDYILNKELEDDDSPEGGVSYRGETLRDFLEEQGFGISFAGNSMYYKRFGEINHMLRQAHIKEITIL